LHATAASHKETDWLQIRMLYQELHRRSGSPLALLSAAVATWHARDAKQALAEVDRLTDRLEGNRLFHATRAEILRELGRHDEARQALDRALSLAVNPAEKHLLTQRLSATDV
jgi:RNA polymerase sigma-70 factor (ECF subfamily)